jgi:hypothetical protein
MPCIHGLRPRARSLTVAALFLLPRTVAELLYNQRKSG